MSHISHGGAGYGVSASALSSACRLFPHQQQHPECQELTWDFPPCKELHKPALHPTHQREDSDLRAQGHA